MLNFLERKGILIGGKPIVNYINWNNNKWA